MASDLTTERLVEAGALVSDCDCIATTGALCRDDCPCKRHTRAALRAILAEAGVDAEGLRFVEDAIEGVTRPTLSMLRVSALLRALAGVLGDE